MNDPLEKFLNAVWVNEDIAELIKEVLRLRAEVERMNNCCNGVHRENMELKEDMFRAWAILFDYDGYYNPKTGAADIKGLVSIIDECSKILNKKGNDNGNKEDTAEEDKQG
jgi:hypothetical protein